MRTPTRGPRRLPAGWGQRIRLTFQSVPRFLSRAELEARRVALQAQARELARLERKEADLAGAAATSVGAGEPLSPRSIGSAEVAS